MNAVIPHQNDELRISSLALHSMDEFDILTAVVDNLFVRCVADCIKFGDLPCGRLERGFCNRIEGTDVFRNCHLRTGHEI